MFSKSCFFERFHDFICLCGNVTFGIVADEMFELLACFGLSLKLVKATAIIEEDDIQKIGVGIVRKNIFKDVNRARVIFFLIIESGHLCDRIPNPARIRKLLVDFLVG